VSVLLRSLLRRNWRIAGALGAFIVFTVIHFAFFRPAAARYKAALASIGGIEAVFNPGGASPMLPPHLFSLIAEHSLSAQDATDRGTSGALGVALLEEIGRLASGNGLQVTASEPGVVAQQPSSLQVRAHVTMRGRYPAITAFFGELARSRTLVLIDRFSITPVSDSSEELEIWVSRLYLKKPARNS
jgi:hypothetical protein